MKFHQDMVLFLVAPKSRSLERISTQIARLKVISKSFLTMLSVPSILFQQQKSSAPQPLESVNGRKIPRLRFCKKARRTSLCKATCTDTVHFGQKSQPGETCFRPLTVRVLQYLRVFVFLSIFSILQSCVSYKSMEELSFSRQRMISLTTMQLLMQGTS